MLNVTNLNNSEFIETDFREGYLPSVKFKSANLENADLRGAILKNTDFTSAKLKGATIDNTFFEGAEISGIDLTGKEFVNSDFPYVRINDNVCSTDEKDIILEGHLQTLF
ncbi:pentapeptide repeat-containing protein [Lactococcus garvieae]|nr:pentapeptide repeat-containing protein [Lactococcus garvieae]